MFKTWAIKKTERLSLCALTWIHKQQLEQDVCQTGGLWSGVSRGRSRNRSEHLNIDGNKKTNNKTGMHKSRNLYLYLGTQEQTFILLYLCYCCYILLFTWGTRSCDKQNKTFSRKKKPQTEPDFLTEPVETGWGLGVSLCVGIQITSETHHHLKKWRSRRRCCCSSINPMLLLDKELWEDNHQPDDDILAKFEVWDALLHITSLPGYAVSSSPSP